MSAALRAAAAADYPAVAALLGASRLPLDGVPAALGGFVVAEADRKIVGVAGVEAYGDAGLLRSVAVAGTRRGTGLGAALVSRALEDARRAGIAEVYLLTTTAERWFPRHGFALVARDAVPAALRTSAEFQGACPASAVVMHRRL